MSDEYIEVGQTKPSGYTIYKKKNTDIGGWDYYSDALGLGYRVIYSYVSIQELEVILEDMRRE